MRAGVQAADDDATLLLEKGGGADEAWHLRLRPSPRRACVSLIGAILALTLFLVVYYAMAPNPALTGKLSCRVPRRRPCCLLTPPDRL